MNPFVLTALLLAPLAALRADDTAKLAALLEPATAQGGTVKIPPGDYQMDGTRPLTLASHMTVSAYGACLRLPPGLGSLTLRRTVGVRDRRQPVFVAARRVRMKFGG
jgi:hypothetical protein